MRAITLPLVGLLFSVGCGPSSLDDAKQVSATSQQLQALVTTHTESTAASTPATCAAEMSSYGAATSKLMGTLGGMCPGLDSCMMGMGRRDQADMMGGVRDLRAEIAAHVASGCRAANLGDEMARHRAAMTVHCQHLVTRADGMSGARTGGMMGCR